MSQSLPLLDDEALAHLRSRLGAESDGPTNGFGALMTERGALPLAALDVHARVDGLLARTALSQTFVNVTDVPLEATYIFPLPDRSAVTGFTMEVAGRTIEADLEERGKARAKYERAIQGGHRAAIAEEERPEVFTLRVGNLMPGEAAVVRFSMASILPYTDGEATYRFPLVVAPRYIPGVPLPGPAVGDGVADDTDRAPDASRTSPPVLLPGFPSPVRLSIEVELHGGPTTIADVRSSLHAAWDDGTVDGRVVRIRPGERLDRDFILRYRLGGSSVRSALSVHPDATGASAGTFALTVLPPIDVPEAALRPRAVAFVLDRSGSMGGWKMTAARRAVASMVETLTHDDAFAVFAFDDSIESPWDGSFGLRPARDHDRVRASTWLFGVEARGGTEMAPALEMAAGALADPELAHGRERLLVLVTDGQVGNEDELLRRLKVPLTGVRVLAVGIDQAVNAGLLRRLADLNGGGACELVEGEARLDERMQAIHRLMAPPLLNGVRLDFAASGLEVEPDALVPERAPDLFPGAPLVMLGRYRGEARGPLVVRAADGRGAAWAEPIQPATRDNPAIAACWARGRLRAWEDRYATVPSNAERDRLERAIVSTSLHFGVLCRFTAYVAIDRTHVVNEGGEVLRITQPVETPAGWDMKPDALMAHYSASWADRARAHLCARRPSLADRARAHLRARRPSYRERSLDIDLCDDALDFDSMARADMLCASAPEAPPTTPELPPRFTGATVLAHGGSGTTYLATDPRFGDVVVRVYPAQADVQVQHVTMARQLAAINAPGVVPILDVVEHAGHLFVVRPRPGTPLLSWLDKLDAEAAPAAAARIVAELAETLAAAHALGHACGDLAADDVWVGDDGRARLIGFGRAPVAAVSPGEVLGAAPTPSGDVYRLGMLLVGILFQRRETSRIPYLRGLVRLLNQVRTGKRTPTRKLVPGLPKALEVICLKATDHDPARRYASAAELAADLRRFLDPASQSSRRKPFWK
jgi:Ca-activated chloride channel family protein